MSIDFFQTVMGQKHYNYDVPEIARQLKRIADAMEKQNELKEKELDEKDNELLSSDELCSKRYSEEQLRKCMYYFNHKNYWHTMSKFQTLSEEFMEECIGILYKDKYDVNGDDCYDLFINNLLQFQFYSAKFVVKLVEEYNFDFLKKCIDKIEKNRRMTEEEKQEIIDTLKIVNKLA